MPAPADPLPVTPTTGASDFVFPDYTGTSLLNLMVSVEQFLGSDPVAPVPPVEFLPADVWTDVNTLVLLILDGLGHEFLTTRHSTSRLAGGLRGCMTSVFPATTASAVTTCYTGLSPAAHAVLAWNLYLKELGVVAKSLPFTARFSNETLARGGVDPARIFDVETLFSRASSPCYLVIPDHLVATPFNRVLSTGARQVGYADVAGMAATIEDLCRGTAAFPAGYKRLVVGYWPDLDGACHEHGVASQAAGDTFRALENALDPLLDAVEADPRVRLLATADHGLVDTTPATRLALADHPRLAETLALPLCGESRAVFCYVRPSRVADFETYVTEHLAVYCELRAGPALAREGIFGPGTPHPRLQDRVGDYVLLMKDQFIFRDLLTPEEPSDLVAFHGGASPAEMHVPFLEF